jgi:acetyl esterase/lipase
MRRKFRCRRLLTVILPVLFFVFAMLRIHPIRSMIMDVNGETEAAQPAQPESGPGGTDYKHSDIKVSTYGEGADQYWIFEPAEPAPAAAPVIVFVHGWSAMYPQPYGAWIKHLVLKGNIVIYPRYQESIRSTQPEMSDAALRGVKAAIRTLREPGHVMPDFDRVAVVGHSLGGVLAANLAALSGRDGLPTFRAAMSVEPGDATTARSPKAIKQKSPTMMIDYSTMPKSILLVCVVGEDDDMVGDVAAVKIFNGAAAVLTKNKNYITFRTDRHGTPLLAADHMMPLSTDEAIAAAPAKSGGPVRSLIRARLEERREEKTGGKDRYTADAFDYYGTWRLFDALTDCAFYKKNCDLALGSSKKLLYMGRWSDGVSVKEPVATINPG